MADEVYRAEIVFDVNDEEAVRRSEVVEDRVLKVMNNIVVNVKRGNERVKKEVQDTANKTMTAAERIGKAFDQMERRGQKFGRERFSPALDLRDELTEKAKQAEKMLRRIGDSKVGVLVEMKGDIQKDLEHIKKTLDEIDREHPRPKITLTDRISSGLRSVRSQLAALTRGAWNVTLRVAQAGGAVMNGLTPNPWAVAGLGAAGIAGGNFALNQYGTKEQSLLAMEFFTGSKKAGDNAYARLQEFAQDTPYSMNYTREQATGLMGVYKNMQSGPFDQKKMMDDTLKTLTAFGDAAGLTGAGENGAQMAMLGFRQIGAIGKLNLEELRQVTENLLVPMELIRKELGVSKEEMADIGKMNIPAEKAMSAIVRALEKNFGGGMEKLSKTYLGMKAALKDLVLFTVEDFGGGLAGGMKSIMKDLQSITDEGSEGFKRFKETVVEVGEVIGKSLEGMYANAKEYILDKYLNNPEFQKLDMEGKIKFVVEDISETFGKWMNDEAIPKIGEWAGTMGASFIASFGAAMVKAIIENPLLALILGVYVGLRSPTPIGLTLAISVIVAPWVKKLLALADEGIANISPARIGEEKMGSVSSYIDKAASTPDGQAVYGDGGSIQAPAKKSWGEKAIDDFKSNPLWLGTLRRNVRGYATGGILTSPHMGLVAEDGPEAIIPLNPKRRDRAMALYEQTGRLLGVTPYAEGGIAGIEDSYSSYTAPVASQSGGSSINIQVSDVVRQLVVNGAQDVQTVVDEVLEQVGSQLTAVLDNLIPE